MIENFAPQRQRLDGIQMLRFWAAMAVVIFHIGSGLQISFDLQSNYAFWGAYGVDAFFIISGFIIAYSTKKDARVFEFVYRRISRIVPLYWFLTFGIASIALLLPSLLNSTSFEWSHFLQSLFFIPHSAPNGVVKPILFLGWTLNYEMFFYAIFAISLLAKKHTLLTCVSLISAFIVLGQILAFESVMFNFYTDTILIEFLFGIGLYKIHSNRPDLIEKYSKLLLILFVVTICIGAGLFLDQAPRFVTQGIPCVFLVAWGLSIKNVTNPILKMTVYGGDLSYALYLSHPYIIQVVIKLFSKYLGFELTLLVALLSVAICLFCSWILFTLVEKTSKNVLQRIWLKMVDKR